MGVTKPGPEIGRPVVIWGAGAMGGCIGAAMARGGMDVLFVDKALDHVAAMNEKGLSIEGPVEESVTPVRALAPSQVEGTFRTIFLCVKAHHTRDAMVEVMPHLADDGAVVSIQNGLCELDISDMVGAHRTVGAFVNFGADYLGPGVIHRGNRGATVVGELDGAMTDRVREIHDHLRIFEPDAVLTDNIFGFLWGKLAYAALLFATALTDDSIADVLDAGSYRETLIALAREVVGVALAKGVALEGFDGFDPEAFRPTGSLHMAEKSMDDLVIFNRGSAKTHSGIWRDLAVRKRTTEVDAQLGWIVRIGGESGIPTPLTHEVIRQIHEIERGDRPLCWENLEDLRAVL